jgi:hypothetical protein
LKIVGDLLWVGGDLGYSFELPAAYMHPNLGVSLDVAEPIGRSATCRGNNDRFPSLFVHQWRDSWPPGLPTAGGEQQDKAANERSQAQGVGDPRADADETPEEAGAFIWEPSLEG